mmetsp:Transcript_6245/g.12102  ORF Transcript_6245/g.12102 Transcript_6245/m.12102 type:complete len:359 (-) Transcript_6245:508-1584(-)
MMHLVLAADRLQYLHRLIDGGFLDQQRLQSPFERRVLFDVLAIFRDGRGTDHLELPTSERGLEHVRRIDSSFRGSGADQSVDLVNEQNGGWGLLVRDLLHDGLQPLLELSAILRTRDQIRQLERNHPVIPQLGRTHPRQQLHPIDLALLLEFPEIVPIEELVQSFHHVGRREDLRHSLGNGSFSHAGLSHQTRVVLPPSHQRSQRRLHLLVPSVHRIQLHPRGQFGEVGAHVHQRGSGALLSVPRDQLRPLRAIGILDVHHQPPAEFGRGEGGTVHSLHAQEDRQRSLGVAAFFHDVVHFLRHLALRGIVSQEGEEDVLGVHGGRIERVGDAARIGQHAFQRGCEWQFHVPRLLVHVQ